MNDRLTIALAQCNPTVGDVDGNIARIRAVRDACKDVDLIVFSELVVSGYPPEDLVLKPAHGYSGHGIFVGYMKKSRAKHIKTALDSGNYIVQQLIPLGVWSEQSI